MRYIDSYRFVFQSDNWQRNLLYASVCVLIPYVGLLVLWGYLFEVIEFKHRHGDDEPYADFDFNRFVDYLKRGLWPFLCGLVVGLVASPVFMVLYFVPMLIFISEPPALVAFVVAVVMVVGMGLLALVTTLVTIPIYLRAGLQQEFVPAFSLDYLKQFVKLTWRELILSTLFLMATGVAIELLGLAACCIGLYPAIAVMMFAQLHIEYQLYELYLQRGGTEIPLKTTAPPDQLDEPSAYLP
jgi:hypothetical protein